MSEHSSQTATERLLNTTARTLRGHGGFVWITLGAIGFGLATIEGWAGLVVAGAVLTLVGIVVHLRLHPSYAALLEQEKDAKQQAALSAQALQGARNSCGAIHAGVQHGRTPAHT